MTVGIPMYQDVNVLDVTGAYETFSWAELDVELVAENAGLVQCRGGLTILVESR